MYRSATTLIILLFSVYALSADSRIERWNLRIDKLKKLQAEAQSGKADKALIDRLTISELQSSEEFLSLLNRHTKDDGSLKSETRKYSLTEIEKKVKEISLPAISLCYISDLYKTAGDTTVKEKIAGEILQYGLKKFGSAIKITAAESISIAELYIIEKGMAEYESALNAATADLLGKTGYELSRSDYNSNETGISRIIQKQIEDYLTVRKFSDNSIFSEKYLTPVPQWKFIEEKYSNTEARNRAVMNFIYTGKSSLNNTENTRDVNSAEKEIFDKAKEKISDMLQNTTPGSGPTGNTPYYEIPDVKKLGVTIDEIDRYRKTLMNNISGSENKDLISRLKSNNTGIAARGISRIEAQFRNEESRIERLRKIKGVTNIYNEEVFKASRTHFINVRDEIYKYADLSAEFIDALYSAGRSDPQKYIDFHKYRSLRYLLYISFSEKLTANTINLSASDSEKLHSLYKGTITKVLASAKNFLKPETIPAEIRESFSKEHLKNYAAINADFRTQGSQTINGIRKNYDESVAGFTRSKTLKKESALNTESQIGQDETDRLYNFAKICSESISSLKYTEAALKKYKDEYISVSEELKKGKTVPGLTAKDTPLSFFASLPGFDPELIEKETATRELLAREGMDSLSSSIAISQYYKRKGIPVSFLPTNEDIIRMKRIFLESPSITVSTWKMNGKNFRQIDTNITAELNKLINKNGWNNNLNKSAQETFMIDETEIKVSFTPPSGWKKIPASGSGHIDKISFESPDMKGVIEVTSVCEHEYNLQQLAGLWPEKSGFTMTEKNWGKKNNSDYIKSTSKNRYDGILESYMFANRGYVIILSGRTTGETYRQMNRILADVFQNMEISSLN